MRRRSSVHVLAVSLLAVSLLAVATSCSSGSPGPKGDRADAHPIRDALQRAVAEIGVDGASVAVIDARGRRSTATGGVADREKAPVLSTTRFAIASITKTFTTVVALRLAARGALDLDAAVDLPGLAAGTTMRDLLGHTAGLPYESPRDGESWTASGFAAAAARNGPLRCAAHACFGYSDLGFVGAGLALERATGSRYADLLAAEVLRPVGLRHTALIERAASAGDVARLDRHDDAGPVPPDAAIPLGTWSAGAVVASAEDLARFGRALLDGELVDERSLSAMQDVSRSLDLPCADRCFRPYGLGLDRTRPGGHVAWGHSGSSGAILAHFPEERTTIAVLTTRRDSGAGILHAVMNAIPGLEDRGDIYAIGADGSGLRPVIHHPLLDGGPSVSPDGRHIVFGSVRDGNAELYVAGADGSAVRRLTDDPAFDLAARWSPDGTMLTFTSDRSGNLDVYVMRADGSGLRRLTRDALDEELPSFSPDGGRIVFNTHSPTGETDIGLVAVDGTGRQILESPDHDWNPSWSPDGSMIVFVRDADGIWVMNADGTAARRISPEGANDRWPAWGPTGRIAFIWRADVWTMAADGTDRRRVTETPAEEYAASWSPDGRELVFTSDAR